MRTRTTRPQAISECSTQLGKPILPRPCNPLTTRRSGQAATYTRCQNVSPSPVNRTAKWPRCNLHSVSKSIAIPGQPHGEVVKTRHTLRAKCYRHRRSIARRSGQDATFIRCQKVSPSTVNCTEKWPRCNIHSVSISIAIDGQPHGEVAKKQHTLGVKKNRHWRVGYVCRLVSFAT